MYPSVCIGYKLIKNICHVLHSNALQINRRDGMISMKLDNIHTSKLCVITVAYDITL